MVLELVVVMLYMMCFIFYNLKILMKVEWIGKDFDYFYLEDGCYFLNIVKSVIYIKNFFEFELVLLEVICDVFVYLEEGGLL